MDDRTLGSGNGGDQRPQFPPLANLDGVQSQLGNIGSKPLNGMHFDELLKNVISADEGQLLQNPNSSSFPTSFFLGNLNGALSKKSADEVWKGISHHEHANAAANESLHQRTIRETAATPEHFLVRTGAINLGNQNAMMNAQPVMGIDPAVTLSQPADWFQFQVSSVQQRMTMLDSNFKVFESVYDNSAVNNLDYSENQAGMSMPMPAISASSSESQATAERKRHFSDEIKEKTIERRQKRMIKNRESAARSRARKQAYTSQLEHEVFRLRKMNSWLKKQKEVEMILSSNPTSMPKYQLRRTSSAPF
ncbi:ABSCISIC ACID-INSENSITIVE 5-like protein 3 [Pyrus ussuriensis x Pyrus communis]|uniref:ABSCISIC ACID-INSENSITIVE 5-like protein 3 n=1 Tax=Pyrus ussuriensis x Pyrus communis TaxID=2448454 RepID=A0A5N5HS04_9ROSA|nr:ABSCISIC ACID-INSENSITIVE 5-like protein 3 [Pyrus ussuriensis x Pyrus communis]